MKALNPIANERGFVLLVVYIVVIFISIFSTVFFARHQVALRTTERYQNRILAFNAAEAGIDSALRTLGTSEARKIETQTGTFTSNVIPVAQGELHYRISPVGGLIRRIDSTGCAPSCTVTASTSRAHQSTDITVYAQIYEPPVVGGLFDYGVYTTGEITLSGTKFDSYNSSLPYGGGNVSSEGEISSNSTAVGAITMTNSTVTGSVLVNAEGNPSTGIITNNSTIIPPVTDPPTPAKGTLPTGWTLGSPPPLEEVTHTDIDLSSITSVKTLPAGVYHCSQIHISGSKGALVTTGAVKIYVDGGVEITGQGTTAANNKPGNLQIYVTGSASVSIKGNGSFFGGLYAPNSDVTFQTSNSGKGGVLYGAVVAKTFSTFGGGSPTIHYDLAMQTAPAPDPNQPDTVSVTAWQEMGSLAWDTGS